MKRLLLVVAVSAASVLVFSGCASGTAPAGEPPIGRAVPGTMWPEPPQGEVVAQGTVMETDGEVKLCLGGIAESYPPQCSGIPLERWSWDGVDGSESASGVTWGAYAVQGTYDGETFMSTQPPIVLALYDPMPMDDPTNGEPGAGTDAELAEIQVSLSASLGEALLTSRAENGWLWVDVVWDDGTFQDAADAEFGEGVVVVRSAMREVL